MVLWEITVVTAYFLGLKRTYKLALRAQRRLIGPNHPKIRQFLHRRTRAVFDVAIKVHQNIQQRDLDVGRSLGNWILRFLDKMKPSANISGTAAPKLPSSKNAKTGSSTRNIIQNNGVPRSSNGSSEPGSSDRRLFSTAGNVWHSSFPTITMRGGTNSTNTTQCRQLSRYQPQVWGLSREGDRFVTGIRADILIWMQSK